METTPQQLRSDQRHALESRGIMGLGPVPDFKEDVRLQLCFRGDPDAVWSYLCAVARGENPPVCHDETVEIIVGEPPDPNRLCQRKPRRKLDSAELAALAEFFGNGPVPFSRALEHADDNPALHSALRLLLTEDTINLDLKWGD